MPCPTGPSPEIVEVILRGDEPEENLPVRWDEQR